MMIPNKMSLVDLCSLLKVTPSWIGNAVRELKLPIKGRGKLREWTESEYYIFKNLKHMRAVNITWSHIKDMRDRELKAQEKIKQILKKSYEIESEGGDKSVERKWKVPCRLVDPIIVSYTVYKDAPNEDFFYFKEQVEEYLNTSKVLIEIDEEVDRAFDEMVKEINDLRSKKYHILMEIEE